VRAAAGKGNIRAVTRCTIHRSKDEPRGLFPPVGSSWMANNASLRLLMPQQSIKEPKKMAADCMLPSPDDEGSLSAGRLMNG